jgi:hypothetical protein
MGLLVWIKAWLLGSSCGILGSFKEQADWNSQFRHVGEVCGKKMSNYFTFL